MELARARGFWLFVTHDAPPDCPPRARKLKTESDNCLAIAIRERDSDVAALLIDEAAKLARRSKELAGKA